MKPTLSLLVLFVSLVALADAPAERGTYVANDRGLTDAGASFTFAKIEKGIVRLLAGELSEDKRGMAKVEFRVTGLFLSKDAYFVAPYNFFVPLCLKDRGTEKRLSQPLACADDKKGYYARVDGKIRPIYLVSHLTAAESLPQLEGAVGNQVEARHYQATDLVIGKVGTFGDDGKPSPTFSHDKIEPLPLTAIRKLEAGSNAMFALPPGKIFVAGMAGARGNGATTIAYSYSFLLHGNANGFNVRALLQREKDTFGQPHDPNSSLTREQYDNFKRIYDELVRIGEDKLGLVLRDGMRGGPAMLPNGDVMGFATFLYPDGEPWAPGTVLFLSTNMMIRAFFTDVKPESPLCEISIGPNKLYLKKAS